MLDEPSIYTPAERSWDYSPADGEFWVVAMDLKGGGRLDQKGQVESLPRALDVFERKFLPVRPEYAVAVVDSAFTLVLQYIAAADGRSDWKGVREVFQLLEDLEVGAPIERLDWELSAKKNAW